MKPAHALHRLVRTPDGTIQHDATGKTPGRGAYICKDEACITKAIKSKGFARSFKQKVAEELYINFKGELSVISD